MPSNSDDYIIIEKEGEEGFCSGCGETVKAVMCLEEIPDFNHGMPSCQKHYYIGSPCCGEDVIKEEG